jgi:hypothetical protein
MDDGRRRKRNRNRKSVIKRPDRNPALFIIQYPMKNQIE